MNKVDYLITAEILEAAKEEFSSHISNNYALSPETLQFVIEMIEASPYPKEEPKISPDGAKIYLTDWQLMEYCIVLLRWEAAKL